MRGRVGTLGTWRGKVGAEVPTGPDFLPAGREALALDVRQGASPGGSGFLGAGGVGGGARGQLTWTGDMEDGVLKEGFLVKRVSVWPWGQRGEQVLDKVTSWRSAPTGQRIWHAQAGPAWFRAYSLRWIS